jgi:hypothetical protein
MSMQFIGTRRSRIFYANKPSEVLIMNDRPTFRDLDEVLSHVCWRMIDDAGREGES